MAALAAAVVAFGATVAATRLDRGQSNLVNVQAVGTSDTHGATPGAAAPTGSTPAAPTASTNSTTTSTAASPAAGSAGGATTATGAVPATTNLPASAATVPAPFAGSGPAGDPVTPTVEQRVVASTWKGFSYDMVANDLAGLSEYATTDARLAVQGSLLCGCLPWPMAYTHVSYSTPPQKTYPASFLAEFSGIDYQQKTFFRDVVFTQASKGEPWLVASTGTYEAPNGLLTPTAHVDTTPPPAPQLTTAPGHFAGFFQQLDSTGFTTSLLPTGFDTNSALSARVSGSRRHHDEYSAEGVQETSKHRSPG